MRKMLKISVAFLLVFISLQGYGQNNQWIKEYPITVGGGFVTSENWAFETYDKGFLLATDYQHGIMIYKTDVNGNILWKRNFSQGSLNPQLGGIAATPDGGCHRGTSNGRFLII